MPTLHAPVVMHPAPYPIPARPWLRWYSRTHGSEPAPHASRPRCVDAAQREKKERKEKQSKARTAWTPSDAAPSTGEGKGVHVDGRANCSRAPAPHLGTEARATIPYTRTYLHACICMFQSSALLHACMHAACVRFDRFAHGSGRQLLACRCRWLGEWVSERPEKCVPTRLLHFTSSRVCKCPDRECFFSHENKADLLCFAVV